MPPVQGRISWMDKVHANSKRRLDTDSTRVDMTKVAFRNLNTFLLVYISMHLCAGGFLEAFNKLCTVQEAP